MILNCSTVLIFIKLDKGSDLSALFTNLSQVPTVCQALNKYLLNDYMMTLHAKGINSLLFAIVVYYTIKSKLLALLMQIK